MCYSDATKRAASQSLPCIKTGIFRFEKVSNAQLRTYFIESYTQYVRCQSTTRNIYTETEHISFAPVIPTILLTHHQVIAAFQD
jgi:hypothetical protein